MPEDPIDRLVSSWGDQRPDLDTTAMATVARLHRLASLVRRQVDASFADHGVSTGEFDVLSALRRQGVPYRLTPSALARATMLSPSGMTNRIDRLVAAGLVARVEDPTNRRVAPVVLTDAGRDAVDALVDRHAAHQHEVLASLSDAERRRLDDLLRRLLQANAPD